MTEGILVYLTATHVSLSIVLANLNAKKVSLVFKLTARFSIRFSIKSIKLLLTGNKGNKVIALFCAGNELQTLPFQFLLYFFLPMQQQTSQLNFQTCAL